MGPECTATALAHPLIDPARSVSNDFSTQGPAQITLVTGSNMAGKSTFLRSVGVNMVLAFMGAPVCAGSMRLSPFRIMSSMRIKDNLEESTSTFYAELKKLKSIIDAVNAHEPAFILLDEILRGTNSHDRQTGAIALVRQLIRQQAIGIIATHDLELAALEKEYPGSLHNYHFDVKVSGTEMYFDYLLKPGICRSMNASLLMQKIGIEV
jgi:DNA mismatch repair ATPase MutS